MADNLLVPDNRTSIGFALSSLSANQLVIDLVQSVNPFVLRKGICVNVFVVDITPFAFPVHFPVFHTAAMYTYRGPVIALDLRSAHFLLKMSSPSPRCFYCYDLEWMRLPRKQYNTISNIYKNPSLQLFTRSEEYADIIKRVWDRDTMIIKPFDLEILYRVIYGQ